MKVIGDKILSWSKGKKIFIIIVLPIAMYATSLFMNNLSVVLLFTFISLTIIREVKLPVTPILVAGLISSNIGGCPLPWADTPAVILTLYSDFTLIDFLNKLFVPCFIFEALLILYIFIWCKYYSKRKKVSCFMNDPKESIFVMKSEPLPPVSEEKSILPPYETPPHIKFYIPKSKFKRFYLPLIVFLLFIFSICIAPFVNISIAYISIFFIGFALILLSKNPVKVLDSLSVTDSLVFISALFMLSGILEYLGILKTAVDYIISFTGDNKVLIILCIILCAFIISTFLSAGPAAATILPVCIQLQPIIGSNIIFAALALGILAGSSMLPWSATGGSVMLNEVNRYINYYDISKEEEVKIRDVYNLKSYISFSVPFSFIILFFSIIYLVIYVSV